MGCMKSGPPVPWRPISHHMEASLSLVAVLWCPPPFPATILAECSDLDRLAGLGSLNLPFVQCCWIDLASVHCLFLVLIQWLTPTRLHEKGGDRPKAATHVPDQLWRASSSSASGAVTWPCSAALAAAMAATGWLSATAGASSVPVSRWSWTPRLSRM